MWKYSPTAALDWCCGPYCQSPLRMPRKKISTAKYPTRSSWIASYSWYTWVSFTGGKAATCPLLTLCTIVPATTYAGDVSFANDLHDNVLHLFRLRTSSWYPNALSNGMAALYTVVAWYQYLLTTMLLTTTAPYFAKCWRVNIFGNKAEYIVAKQASKWKAKTSLLLSVDTGHFSPLSLPARDRVQYLLVRLRGFEHFHPISTMCFFAILLVDRSVRDEGRCTKNISTIWNTKNKCHTKSFRVSKGGFISMADTFIDSRGFCCVPIWWPTSSAHGFGASAALTDQYSWFHWYDDYTLLHYE